MFRDHIIFNAFTKVVRTKGNASQNHGLRAGIASIIIITIAEMKNKIQFFAEEALPFIVKICANIREEEGNYELRIKNYELGVLPY